MSRTTIHTTNLIDYVLHEINKTGRGLVYRRNVIGEVCASMQVNSDIAVGTPPNITYYRSGALIAFDTSGVPHLVSREESRKHWVLCDRDGQPSELIREINMSTDTESLETLVERMERMYEATEHRCSDGRYGMEQGKRIAEDVLGRMTQELREMYISKNSANISPSMSM